MPRTRRHNEPPVPRVRSATEGATSTTLEARVDVPSELMCEWAPERIARFFAALAEAIAAVRKAEAIAREE